MKFRKISLDESLFDDEFDSDMSVASQEDWIDDDFSDVDYEKIANMSKTPTGPSSSEKSGIADSLIHLINDEWEAIRGYNDFAEMAKVVARDTNNAVVERMLPIIDDIRNEENKHVGQLQELLKLISPNASSIESGATEGRQQLSLVDGKLPVETHTPAVPNKQNSATPNEIDTMCYLYDVDDSM